MQKKKKVTKAKTGKTASSITPLGDRVLVRPFTEAEARGEKDNKFGIILPDSVSKEKSAQGKVIAVGTGRFVDGKRLPIQVKVGDIVIFSKYSYDEVELNGEELYMLREDNILGVLD